MKRLITIALGIQNVFTAIDPKTGKKTINPEGMPGDGKVHIVCPHPGGGRSDSAPRSRART